jgi:hypothetical protein
LGKFIRLEICLIGYINSFRHLQQIALSPKNWSDMEDVIKRFDWFFDRHIGLGIRWDNFFFPLHLSISVPFITVNIGIGTYPKLN